MRVEWLTAAEDDLREIARRVALNFGRDTAERAVASVVEETQRLSTSLNWAVAATSTKTHVACIVQ